MSKIRILSAAFVAITTIVAMAACQSSHTAPPETGACLRSASIGSASAYPRPTTSPIPDVALDCLDGSGPVRLASVTVPSVVNLWATWCPECKREIPAVQAFATAASGKVAVIGVDSGEPRSFGRSYVTDKQLTYPMLSDPDLKLSAGLGRRTLPLTLFVRPGGDVAYVYTGPALDVAELADLTHSYLGVRVRV